ncbi:diaminobutyrate decarboxylase [Candidatus Methanomethylophilus sp. 1R26]|uniref:pyridoxal phosphate-dependent decarboxylase family protein n=1 Tax=Candidatus Methanomethylophilus sp. 1R26 TaxID=1769296 RepID=UPI000736A328|nr:pyridoxal-dependent decarboxylase [Candidatus Methanomethylophilus sp. 1R26]KUE73740.1 diaminobutyrate decarboxylase [Candidatus Methanomethylophilus sp. 1R26]
MPASDSIPVLLSDSEDVKKRFTEMIEETLRAVLSSYSDGSAFSGIGPYELRKEVRDLGFLPVQGKGFDKVLEETEKVILPNMLRTWSVKYMPHLHSPALTESICSELIIACFNDSMDSWDQGPAATELEVSMIRGLEGLYGFPPETADGYFTSGGSQSNISAILAARDWYCMEKFGWDVKKKGLPPEFGKLRLYASDVSHFTMEKACHILGMGYEAVRKVPVDSKCRMDLGAFAEMLEEDVRAGLFPFCAVATLGTTDFGSIDDARGMRALCDRYGMHLHADAAYGSGLIMSRKYRERISAVSLCDSVTVDFHKMFLLPISCSALLMKDGERLKCFELHADYLNREEDEEEGYINLVGKSMQTTRRFDALKVFMAFQTRGEEGYGRLIDTAVENAAYFYRRISADPDFIAPVEPEISSVVFALDRGDGVNKGIRRRLMDEGTVIGQTVMDGRVMLKFTLLNPNLDHATIDSIIARIKEIGTSLS